MKAAIDEDLVGIEDVKFTETELAALKKDDDLKR